MVYPAAAGKKPLILPHALVQWIDGALPEIHGVCSVKLFSCDRLPFVGARYSGITLFNSIYLRCNLLPIEATNLPSIEVLFHEFIHIEQFRRQRLFPLSYLLRLGTHGYWNHPAEIEARDRAGALIRQYSKDLSL
jgi:hypothetical protein